jgi:hypothetical protein
MFHTCQWHWKLNYIDGIKVLTPKINLIFGSAMHDTIQEYFKKSYQNELISDIDELLKNNLKKSITRFFYNCNFVPE